MKIIVDAMGGDNAPEAIVKGAVYARDRLGAEIVLVCPIIIFIIRMTTDFYKLNRNNSIFVINISFIIA